MGYCPFLELKIKNVARFQALRKSLVSFRMMKKFSWNSKYSALFDIFLSFLWLLTKVSPSESDNIN